MSCTGVWTAWTRKSLGFNVQFLNIRIEQLAIEKKSSVSQADMWHPRQEVTPCCDPPTRIVPTEEGTLQASWLSTWVTPGMDLYWSWTRTFWFLSRARHPPVCTELKANTYYCRKGFLPPILSCSGPPSYQAMQENRVVQRAGNTEILSFFCLLLQMTLQINTTWWWEVRKEIPRAEFKGWEYFFPYRHSSYWSVLVPSVMFPKEPQWIRRDKLHNRLRTINHALMHDSLQSGEESLGGVFFPGFGEGRR